VKSHLASPVTSQDRFVACLADLLERWSGGTRLLAWS
jgi:hypothetical protein